MTPSEPTSLSQYLAGAHCMLFDFDGPLVRLFAGLPAPGVAKALRVELRRRWGVTPGGRRLRRDCHGLVAALPGALAGRADEKAIVDHMLALLTQAERRAVRGAVPTKGAEDLVRQLDRSGWQLAVTSNNAGAAIGDYLDQERSAVIKSCFNGMVFGREDIARMKPDPFCVRQALLKLGLEASSDQAVLLGDSVSDFTAAAQAGVRFVGYSGRRRRRRELRRAGALHVVRELSEIGQALECVTVSHRAG